MENKLELGLISTASTNSVGFLDTYGDEPVNIKMSISDIKDISKRSAPYTQSFTIQGSEKNNRLLTQIFNIGSDSTFDARKKTPAYLAVDSIPVMQNGVFQLVGIAVNENKKIDYQVTIFSESQDLFKNIGDAYIEDLDFSDLNHVWDYSGITLSWTGSNQSYFYPLIDYGYDLNITDMNIGMGVKAEEMFPALQVKTIVDRIFSAAGYSYDSTFLSGTYFTNLYIPFNGTTELNQDNSFATGRSFDVGISTDYTLIKTYLTPPLDGNVGTQFGVVQPGELFYVTIRLDTKINVVGAGGDLNYNLYSVGTNFYNKVSTKALPGQTLIFNGIVPKKIKQKDFLNSLIYMHNLYLDPVKDNTKKIIVEPRDTYFSRGLRTKDWTKKLDLKFPISQKLISEQQNKKIIFTYKEDKDYYNEDYKTTTTRIFGDEYFIIDNEFIDGEKKIEVIFSPTPSASVHESSLSSSSTVNEFVIPKIGKKDSNKNFGRTDFNIRILQKNTANILPLPSADSWLLSGQTQTYFPYLGMLNHPSTGTTDIAFGKVDYEYYNLDSITDNNLINAHWKTYLDGIADKDSRIISCNIYLTPQDINDFKFSDSIFIDGISEDGAGHYFIVNSINYSPTSNESSKVELIKLKEKFVSTTTSTSIYHPWNNPGDPVQVVAVGGPKILSTGGIGSGQGVFIDYGSQNSIAVGRDLIIGAGSPRSMIVGSGSTIDSGLKSTFIFGDNISANTANTVYVPNLISLSGISTNGISATTFFSGSTNLETIISNLASGIEDITRVQPGSNITTGGTANLPIINVVDSPSFNSISSSGASSFTTLSASTLISGSTNIENIFIQGSGSTNTIPLWNGNKVLGNSILTQGTTGLTVNGSIQIYGNVDVLGTATTFNTATDRKSDNNIVMNLSGSHLSALNGVISVLSGLTNGVASTWTIDSKGAWSANTEILTSAITVNGGNISVTNGSFISGSTDVSTLFATPANITLINSQLATKANLSGATFTGTVNGGNIAGSTVFGTILSGNTLYSGASDVSTLFATPANITSINSQLATKANLSGATFTGTVNGGNIAGSTVFGTTLSGNTLYSGASDVSLLFGSAALAGTHSAQLLTKANRSGDTFTGNVGIGTTSTVVNKLEINDVDKTPFTLYEFNNFTINTTDTAGIDKGGSMSFGGKYSTASTVMYGFSAIKGAKEDSVSGLVNGYLSFLTSVAGQGSIERMRIGSTGIATIKGSLVVTGNTTLSTLSATTVSGNTLYSGASNVSLLFGSAALAGTHSAQLLTKANLSGATFTGQVNTPILSATTISATTAITNNNYTSGALTVGANSNNGDFVQFTDTFDGTVFNTNNWTATGVVTQNNDLSISGISNWTSHGITSTQAYDRTNTLTLMMDVINPNATSYAMYGWASTTTMNYTNMPHAIYFYNGGGIAIYENAVSVFTTSYVYTAGITYRLKIVTNENYGAKYYLSNNSGDTWTTLYDGSANTSVTQSPLYVRSTVYSPTGIIIDNVSVSNGIDVLNPSQFFPKNLSIRGTVNAPSFSATTVSGATIFSASTDVSLLFGSAALAGTHSAQLLTKANLSGATFTGNILAPSLSATTVTATTVGGGTLYSGATELSLITNAQINANRVFVQPGSNITTGGTANSPIINVATSPSFNALTLSGILTTSSYISLPNYSQVDFKNTAGTVGYGEIFVDNATGTYAGPNGMVFYLNGATRIAILSGGSVGIGIVAPLVKLESRNGAVGIPATSGTDQPNAALRLSSTASEGILDFGLNSSNQWIQSTDRTDLSQSYTLSLNPKGGFVGVGTTAPTVPLEIGSGATSLNKMLVHGIINTNTTTGEFFKGGTTVAGATQLFSIYNSALVRRMVIGYGTTGGNVLTIGQQLNSDMVFNTNATEKVRILANGNVGIGTTTPLALSSVVVASATLLN